MAKSHKPYNDHALATPINFYLVNIQVKVKCELND